MNDINRAVAEIVQRHKIPGENFALTSDYSNHPELGLDSLSLVHFIVDLEERFSIEFPSEMLNNATFLNLQTVIDAIQELLDKKDKSSYRSFNLL